MVLIELFQRRHSQKFAVEAKAEERDCGIDEAVHVERMYVLGRAVQIGEREVTLQQLANVLDSRVVDCDLPVRHRHEATRSRGLNKIRDSIYVFPSKTRKIKVSAKPGSTPRPYLR